MPSLSPSRSPVRGRSLSRTPAPLRSPVRRTISPRASRPARNGDRASGPPRSRSPIRSRSRSRSRTVYRARSYTQSRSRSATPPMPRSSKVVIEKLTKNVTETHLREIFEVYGGIEQMDMPMNRQFMTNRGTAYILFHAPTAAESAIAHMHEAQLDGAQINVSIVLPRRRFSRSPPLRRPPPDRFGETHRYGTRDPPTGPPARVAPPRYRSSPGRSPPRRRSPPGRAGGNVYRPRERSYSPRRSYSRSRSRSFSRDRSMRDRSLTRSPPPRRRPYSPPRGGGGGGGRRRRSPSYDSYDSRSRSRSRSRPRGGRR